MFAEPPRVFISYATRDGSDTAVEVRRLLDAHGISVWHDSDDLSGDSHWWSQVEDTLRSRSLQHIVIVVTPGALDSEHVREEIALARGLGITLSPVRGPGLDELCKLPIWLGNVYDLDNPTRREGLLRVLSGPGATRRVPRMAPAPPVDYVPRVVEFESLKNKLLQDDIRSVGISAALKGAGGYGKTTLAKQLAHDQEVEQTYFDGTLWVEIGEEPANIPAIVSDLVERLVGERPGFETASAAGAALGEALGGRRILIVIDDIWDAKHLMPFLVGGPNTKRLITTRDGAVLPPRTDVEVVDVMTSSEALDLIESDLPVDCSSSESDALEELAAQLKAWPLLLRLANGFLRSRIERNNTLSEAICAAKERYDAKGVTAFDARNELDRSKTVEATISVSLDLLQEGSYRTRFFELGLFAEDVLIPIDIIDALWRETGGLDSTDGEDFLVELHDLSLLLALDLSAGTVRIHDTIRSFAGRQLSDVEVLHSKLATILEKEKESEDSDSSLEYYYLYLPYHLVRANRRDELNGLLVNPNWIKEKTLAMGGPIGLLEDYGQYGSRPIHELILGAVQLSAHTCVRDPQQSLVQIAGRLLGRDDEECRRFVMNVEACLNMPSILMRSPTLKSPGIEIGGIDGHMGEVMSLALLKDGRLISGSTDKTLRIWGRDHYEEEACLDGHSDWVVSIVEVGGVIYSGGEDKTVQAWKTEDGESVAVHNEFHSGIIAIEKWISGGVVFGTWDGTIGIIDGDGTRVSVQVPAAYGSIAAICMLESKQFVCGCGDGSIRIIDFDVQPFPLFSAGHHVSITCLAVTREGVLVSGAIDGSIKLWDGETGVELAQVARQPAAIRSICPLPSGGFATGRSDGGVGIWSIDGRLLSSVRAHTRSVNALVSVGNDRFASGSSDRRIKLWNAKCSHELARMAHPTVHDESVTALAVHGNGDAWVSGSWDRVISRWLIDSSTGQWKAEEGRFELQVDEPITSIESISLRRLLVGCADGTLVVASADGVLNKLLFRGTAALFPLFAQLVMM